MASSSPTTSSSTMSSSNQNTAEALKNKGEDIARRASETADRAQAMAGEQMERLEIRIRQNPLAAVGIAAGAGFLLAMLARR